MKVIQGCLAYSEVSTDRNFGHQAFPKKYSLPLGHTSSSQSILPLAFSKPASQNKIAEAANSFNARASSKGNTSGVSQPWHAKSLPDEDMGVDDYLWMQYSLGIGLSLPCNVDGRNDVP